MSTSVVVLGKNRNVISRDPTKVGTARMGGSSPSKYSVFIYYAIIADLLGETDWKDFFEVFAKGNFWKGMKFDGTMLTCKTKKGVKTFHVEVSGTMDPETDIETDIPFYESCKNFIKENSSHFSKKDVIVALDNDLEIIEEILKGFENSPAKQCMYIEEFVIRKCREFGLKSRIETCLIGSIVSKLSNKSIHSSALKLSSDGTISHIEGLTIDQDGYFFDQNIAPSNKKRKIKETNNEDSSSDKPISFRCSKGLSLSIRRSYNNEIN